jgi:hypothetical protein
MDRLAGASVTNLGGFNPQNLSNTLWAFASLEYQPEGEVLSAFAAEVLNQVAGFPPQVRIFWRFFAGMG